MSGTGAVPRGTTHSGLVGCEMPKSRIDRGEPVKCVHVLPRHTYDTYLYSIQSTRHDWEMLKQMAQWDGSMLTKLRYD